MLINNESYRTIWFDKKKEEVNIIDQTKLPFYLEIVTLNNLEDVINAINFMISVVLICMATSRAAQGMIQ